MHEPKSELRPQLKAVSGWLYFVAFLIALMVLVGGATRLTESGLSIVEWKPVTGSLPPLTAQAWHEAFEAYKTIPQYRAMNFGMSLEEFKTIFWWEWSHRLLGRFIGFAFLLPFLWFIWKGGLASQLKRRLWFIFGLGALQGAVGWWMVASGLTQRVEVSQYRLAAHFILALIIYTAILWTLLQLRPVGKVVVPLRTKITSHVLLALVFLQLYFGALVAGLRAGLVYNTWPQIDGALIPSSARLFFETPWWRNLFDNPLTVQFMHRMIAYTLLVVAILHVIDVVRSRVNGRAVNGAFLIAVAMIFQAFLGVVTLLFQVPISIALLHQAGAIVVLTLVVAQVLRLTRDPADAAKTVSALR